MDELTHHANDLMTVLGYVALFVGAMVVAIIKVIWSRQTKLYDIVNGVQLDLAGNYTKNDDFKDEVESLKKEFHNALEPLCDRVTKMDDFLRRGPTLAASRSP